METTPEGGEHALHEVPRSQPTYKGWKLITLPYPYWDEPVPSLPTRDGNL